MIQVLSDQNIRTRYDLFGASGLDTDPRNDELHLLLNLFLAYLFWWVMMYIITIPKHARAARGYGQIVLLLMFIGEGAFYLTDFRLPLKDFLGLTEYQVIYLVHSTFPFIVLNLYLYSESIFVDVEKQFSDFVEVTLKSNQVLHNIALIYFILLVSFLLYFSKLSWCCVNIAWLGFASGTYGDGQRIVGEYQSTRD